jgi:hypothetical protein
VRGDAALDRTGRASDARGDLGVAQTANGAQ